MFNYWIFYWFNFTHGEWEKNKKLKKISLIFFLLIIPISAQSDSTKWRQFLRLGAAGVDSSNGAFGYYRLNMQTKTIFRDLRLFTYGLDNNSFVHLRYKSSNKYISRPNFYRYTNYFSSKFEIEYFEQISEVIENKLSRGQYLIQLIFPMKKNIFINMNFEKEDFFGEGQTDASSVSLAIEWNR